MRFAIILILLFWSICFGGCCKARGDAMFNEFFGPQQLVLPRASERLKKDFTKSYTIIVKVLNGNEIHLLDSRNASYTLKNQKLIAIFPTEEGTFDSTEIINKRKRYVYCVLLPKEGKPLWALIKVKVRVKSGPLYGAILAIKPGDLIFGDEASFPIASSIKDPVQAFYEIPNSWRDKVDVGNLDIEIVSIVWK